MQREAVLVTLLGVSMTWLSTRSSEMGPVALRYEELLLEVAPC